MDSFLPGSLDEQIAKAYGHDSPAPTITLKTSSKIEAINTELSISGEQNKMADLLECLLCGYKTVRCGMKNHMTAKHPQESRESKDVVEQWAQSLGTVKNWSKDRTQKPVLKFTVEGSTQQ
jgi:hypothetical protein